MIRYYRCINPGNVPHVAAIDMDSRRDYMGGPGHDAATVITDGPANLVGTVAPGLVIPADIASGTGTYAQIDRSAIDAATADRMDDFLRRLASRLESAPAL